MQKNQDRPLKESEGMDRRSQGLRESKTTVQMKVRTGIHSGTCYYTCGEYPWCMREEICTDD